MLTRTVERATTALSAADAEVAAAEKAYDELAAKRTLQVERGDALEVRTASRYALDSAERRVELVRRRREDAAELAALAKAEAKALAKCDATADAVAAAEAAAVEALTAALEAARPALASVEKAAEAARAALPGISAKHRVQLGVYPPSAALDGLATATPLEIARRHVRVLEAQEMATSMANNHATAPNAGRPWPKDFKFTTHPPPKDY